MEPRRISLSVRQCKGHVDSTGVHEWDARHAKNALPSIGFRDLHTDRAEVIVCLVEMPQGRCKGSKSLTKCCTIGNTQRLCCAPCGVRTCNKAISKWIHVSNEGKRTACRHRERLDVRTSFCGPCRVSWMISPQVDFDMCPRNAT